MKNENTETFYNIMLQELLENSSLQ